MKFKVYKKGTITAKFVDAGTYKEIWGHDHTGVDWVPEKGYAAPVTTDNAGLVYKVIYSEQSPSNWQAVYLLVPHENGFMEVCYGHLSYVKVKEGERVKEDDILGLEGNRGDVQSQGVKITRAMQLAGDKRGHHVHEQYRPVRCVKRINPKKHYLNTATGARYRGPDRCYYEIENNDVMLGCVDPMKYAVHAPKEESTLEEKIELAADGLEAKGDKDADVLRQFKDYFGKFFRQ